MEFRGDFLRYSGIYIERKLKELFLLVADNYMSHSCKLVEAFWMGYFSEYGLATYEISSFSEFYCEEWNEYIILDGQKCVCTSPYNLSPIYSPIISETLKKRHGESAVELGKAVYLDGNKMNIADSNFALFRNESDAKRYEIGKSPCVKGEDGIYYVNESVNYDEFIRMYKIYSNYELSNIYEVGKRTIEKWIKDYGLPSKSMLKAMGDDEYERLFPLTQRVD
jgi:hypothetical protein